MTASEFAFLALGLVLGVASGAALVLVVRSRPPARVVRMTVERDAVPRRGATLSSDAFVTASAEPARGGPADRRHVDREPASFSSDRSPFRPSAPVPMMAPQPPRDRTIVSFDRPAPASAGIPVVSERDPSLDVMRAQAAIAAERLYRDGGPLATALLEARAQVEPRTPPPRTDATALRPRADSPGGTDPARMPVLVRILRGDHHALFATTAILAGKDQAERRPWQAALMGFASALSEQAIRAGWLDVAVGNPFWDTFTISQCREIAEALAVAGYRFDGVDGWEENRVPTYRELAMAVAAAGLEPRRIRAWPTQDEIAALYREVTVATDDFLVSHAPNMDLEAVQAVVGIAGPERERLWTSWDRVRATLVEPPAAA